MISLGPRHHAQHSCCCQLHYIFVPWLLCPCRRDLILAAQSSDELVELLQDLSQLRVVPLLQAVLFDV